VKPPFQSLLSIQLYRYGAAAAAADGDGSTLGGPIIGLSDGSAFYGIEGIGYPGGGSGDGGGAYGGGAGRRRLLAQIEAARARGGGGGGDGGRMEDEGRALATTGKEKSELGYGGSGYGPRGESKQGGGLSRGRETDAATDARARGIASGGAWGLDSRHLDYRAGLGQGSHLHLPDDVARKVQEQLELRDDDGEKKNNVAGGRGSGVNSPSRRRFQGSRG
jgi:hypothetical protein